MENFIDWMKKENPADNWKPTEEILGNFLNDPTGQKLKEVSKSNVRCLHCNKSIDDCKNNECLKTKNN
jgi:hypothetical protein